MIDLRASFHPAKFPTFAKQLKKNLDPGVVVIQSSTLEAKTDWQIFKIEISLFYRASSRTVELKQ